MGLSALSCSTPGDYRTMSTLTAAVTDPIYSAHDEPQ